uniref:Curli production assembly/transport component CsgF n=1 Tax=Angiostrongylus cantonensis TaxID=6313 RepID=A0A0K0CYP6_ANGCA
MKLSKVFLGLLFATVHAKIYSNGYPQNYNPFDDDFNSFSDGFFKTDVFNPDWGSNLAKEINDQMMSNFGYHNIDMFGGKNVISVEIGGRRYSTQLPPNSSVSLIVNNDYINGRNIEEVRITVNGVVTVYRTTNGRTVVTDGYGNVRTDGGLFHINSSGEYGSY